MEAVVALVVILVLGGLIAGVVVWRRAPCRRPPVVSATPAVAPKPQALSFGDVLRRDAAAGRYETLLRRLDRELPEWPASSSLIEAARDLFALESGVKAALAAGVPDAITDRLAQEVTDTAELLWRRADRIATVARSGAGSAALEEQMGREDEKLVRLRQAIQEARTGLAELTLAADGGPDAFRRTEGRFRALAATARELQELDQGPQP